MAVPLFLDRQDAGRRLARELSRYAGRDDLLVLALPRGGVPVGFEVARSLGSPLGIFIVRKLGVPGHEELAMGAVASGGTRFVNREVVAALGISPQTIDRVTSEELQEIERRAHAYEGDRPPPDARGKTVILVDDGLATGSTMRAAVGALRLQDPGRIVVAVPVAAPEVREVFKTIADEIVCVATPEPFQAVGLWYDDFSQTTDEEVRRLLHAASESYQTGGRERMSRGSGSAWDVEGPSVRVLTSTGDLEGNLTVPEGARGVVLFAHGSGSSRLSPRNRYVAAVLNQAGLATLLIDLLTASEEQEDMRTAHLRFDIGFLAERLLGAAHWLTQHPGTGHLTIGYFGASTGAGAALVAAAQRPDLAGAVVSRGGRPDLAGPALPQVKAPTLLLVGGADEPVIELNKRAMAQMRAPVELRIVPGATHLFEEPGTLEEVARQARDWFAQHLTPVQRRDPSWYDADDRTGL